MGQSVGCQTDCHAVVATGMHPEVWQGPHTQRSHLWIGVIAHQRRHLFAIHGLADVLFFIRRTVGRIPDALIGVGELGHTGFFPQGHSLAGQLGLQASRHCFQPFSHARDCIVSVVMVEVGFDVLRVVHIAVVAFPVVLPDQLPVGIHLEIHDFGHLATRQALRPGNRGYCLIGRVKVHRLMGEADED